MSDYEKVTNPFITLKKLSPNKTESSDKNFKAELNTLPPNVDNDVYRSNLKKSNHSLYSDERAEKLKLGEVTNTLESYAITLLDIDNIIYEYFINVIRPQVLDTHGSIINVPVRHASPEKWSAIKNDGVYRDKKGQIQRPMIIFTRSSMSRDDSFIHFNKYLTSPFVKKFDAKNMYDKFSILNDMQPVYEVHNITFPDHVILTYEFTINTDYVEQMNQLVEKINFASDDYWGDPKKLKFRTSVDSFSNTVESSADDDRNVSTSFSMNVNAYLLPEVFDDRMTATRKVSKRKVLWGTEAVSSDDPRLTNNLVSGINTRSPAELGTKIRILDRLNHTLNLGGPVDEYDIRLRLDEEYYTIETEQESYLISINKENENDPYLIWDYEQSEIFLRKNQEIYFSGGNIRYHLKVNKKHIDMFTIKVQ